MPAGSMGDTLLVGDKILVRVGPGVPAREKMIVLRYPVDHRQTFVNASPAYPVTVSEPGGIMIYPPAQEMLKTNVADAEVVVPPGKYFVLGDNRDQSLDSRYWGFVDASEIIGTPVLIYESRQQSTDEATGENNMLKPKRVRWERLFMRL